MLKMYKTLTAFLNLLINQIFHYFFKKNFSTYSKMYKNSSAKFYQNNKGRLQKKARERYQSLLKKKKKSGNMAVKDIKIKNNICLSIEKNIIKCIVFFILRQFEDARTSFEISLCHAISFCYLDIY